MITFLLIILLGALTLVGISVQKTYAKTPLKELKRRAAKGDEVAKALHTAVAYGVSLDVLLWIIVGLSAAGFFVVLTDWLPDWMALFGCAALLWFGFAWIPNAPVSGLSSQLAQRLAPALAWVVERLYPVLRRAGNIVQKRAAFTFHSGLYQKEDLVELLDKQAGQPDNRMTADELRIVKGALTYNDKLIREVMTPNRVMNTVKQGDSLGPLLLDELHKSGFSRFPVVGGNPDEYVGVLYMKDLVAIKAGGLVSKHMKKPVYYVNEDRPLQHALQAFLRTKRHLFMVVNSFEEVVGIITIEDVLEQVVGKQIVDEFDKYEDLRAVAALEAKKAAEKHDHPAEDGDSAEVVEKTEA